jgi:hypothetical protein
VSLLKKNLGSAGNASVGTNQSLTPKNVNVSQKSAIQYVNSKQEETGDAEITNSPQLLSPNVGISRGQIAN